MTPPTVLIDLSLLSALGDPQSPAHDQAASLYLALVDRFERHQVRLRARADHLAQVPDSIRAGVLAPVESIHVARQFRRQAARWAAHLSQSTAVPTPIDVAVTHVVMRRESITEIATLPPPPE